ncbi:MAG: aspartate kinase [Candidatus Saganbacteria bacterium]|nr:aspartate kinase [Candidatus Saganbacteria bacterium]
MTIVHKYGGTSVGSVEKIKNVAKKVAAVRAKGNKVVVIVSAMGHTTDELIDLMHQITKEPHPREYDMLVSTGEQVSAALLSLALQEISCPAISLTGGQAGVETEDIYRKGRIKNIKLKRIEQELKEGKVVIVTGFQGIDSKGDIITIGRGGSDTSAVAIAAALKADVCDIYTDVDGVYTTDPRIVTEAKKLKTISYEEMLELASLGAQVLHPRAVECAMVYGIKIHLRSSTKDIEGTYIREGNKMEVKKAVRGVALDKDIAKIGILKVPDKPGSAAKLFKALADAKINVDMIIQSVHSAGSQADMAFTVGKGDAIRALEITKNIAKAQKAEGAVCDTEVEKVSIVGTGMISQPGVAAKMFEALSSKKINIEMISTSEIKISCVVTAGQGKKAVAVLHKKFDLGK